MRLRILIDLSNNWDVDYYIVVNHLLYMRYVYCQNRYSLSFLRLPPYTGGIIPVSLMDEAKLLKVMYA
ncbi:hypothetical protein [Candidatus Gullanella endobia]|uniref:hypothetical protein n=1 Tax=Candidatus Gullanella endobia TaxID=1070130 RepID=UPI0013158AB9|nr:hypothetical protein [Candidatus Gullanella endobia]